MNTHTEQFFRPADPTQPISEDSLTILTEIWSQLSDSHPYASGVPYITVNEEFVEPFGVMGRRRRMIEIVDETNELIVYINNIVKSADEEGLPHDISLTEMLTLGLNAVKMHLSDHSEL